MNIMEDKEGASLFIMRANFHCTISVYEVQRIKIVLSYVLVLLFLILLNTM